MRDNKRNIVRSIIAEIFSRKSTPRDLERRIDEWIVDPQDEELKDEALKEKWEELDLKPTLFTRLTAAKQRRQIERSEGVGRSLGRRVALGIVATAAPLLIAVGSWLSLRQGDVEVPQTTKIIAMSVPNGKTDETLLPDSTKAWINAGSELQYTENQENRMAELEGESYFSVKKDPSKPFIVKTKDLTVTVLGTEFNVRAYPQSDYVTVTLNSGKISLTTDQGDTHQLSPNQKFWMNRITGESGVSDITELDAGNISKWREGELIFDQMPMMEILMSIERWYDIKMEIDSATRFADKQYSVKFTSQDNLHSVMNVLKYMDEGLEYLIEEGKVIISR